MRHANLLLVVLALLCVAAVDCPPTDTPAVPTATYHPTRTPSPTETVKPTPTVDTPTDTPAPDPVPSETRGVASIPERDKHPAETLPVTGGGAPPNVQIGLTLICSIGLLFVALMARRARRGTH